MKMRIAGVVLAGGQSRRFGRDKAAEPFRGIPLMDWALAGLGAHADLLMVAGRRHPNYETVDDRPMPGLGPLGGLAGSMQAAAAAGYSHLLSLPCDTPCIPEGLLAKLCQQTDGAFLNICPVIGIWPTRFGIGLETYLASGGDKSVRAWATSARIRPLSGFDDIANINYEADLAAISDAND